MSPGQILPYDVLRLCGLYLRDGKASRTLASLGRCSQALHDLVASLLFEQVTLRSDAQFSRFLNALADSTTFLNALADSTKRAQDDDPFLKVNHVALEYLPSDRLCLRVCSMSRLDRFLLLPNARSLYITPSALMTIIDRRDSLAVPMRAYRAIGPSLFQRLAPLLNPSHICLDCHIDGSDQGKVEALVSQLGQVWSALDSITTHGEYGIRCAAPLDLRPQFSKPVRYRHYVRVLPPSTCDVSQDPSYPIVPDEASPAERMCSLIYERAFQEARGTRSGYREVVCEGMKPGDVLMLERQVVEIVRRTVLPSLEGRVLTMVEGVERLRRFRFAAEEEVEGCEICEY